MTKRRRTCVFCGAEGVTAEHMWGDWISKRLENYGPFSGGFGDPDNPTALIKSKTIGGTVKRFCATCNNGWMSDIENAAIPILEPMILFKDFRRTIGLSPREQSVLAQWAYKTALVMDFAIQGEPPWIPPLWYADFYRRRWPRHHGVVIWLAAYGGRQRAVQCIRRTSIAVPEGREGSSQDPMTHTKVSRLTFSVRHVVFQVLFFYGGEWQPFLSHAWDPISFVIWPATGVVINWPKSRLGLDIPGLRRFAGREDL